MLTAAESLASESEAHEAAEPSVEANPKIGREALGYLAPRMGLDGLAMAGKCGNCQSYVPEAAMGGALIGSRCAILGSTFPINDDASCNRFAPWGSGLPCEAVTNFYAMELRKRYPGALSPMDAGYKFDPAAPQCCNCRFFDVSEDTPAVSECELFEDLQARAPNLFDLNKVIQPRARCSMWTPRPEMEYPK